MNVSTVLTATHAATDLTNVRRPMDAATVAEVWQYYDTRSRQMLLEGYTWSERLEWAPGYEGAAIRTFFKGIDERAWVSFFVLPEHRANGIMTALTKATNHPVLTVTDCEIASLLHRHGIEFHLVGDYVLDSVEYDLCQEFYGDQKSNRSQVFLMNHIDEGLAVMNFQGASTPAMRAFCLHPLLQSDVDLAANFGRVAKALATVPDGGHTLALAMEYRSVANAYLAHSDMPATGIRLSPLAEVNDMLIGDKVQNRKDFELYFRSQTDFCGGSRNRIPHTNYARLNEYFQQWCDALGVAEKYSFYREDVLPGRRTVQTEIADIVS